MAQLQLTPDDVLRFLQLAYFGNIEEPYKAAGDRAYRDFCRTVKFPKADQSLSGHNQTQTNLTRQRVKDGIYRWLQKEIMSLDVTTQEDYDLWHCTTCNRIIAEFTPAALHYGQAQKWLNMMMKYLLVLGVAEIEKLTPFIHVPIDNIVIQTAKGLKTCGKPWSQWNEGEYMDYQRRLNTYISKENPNMAPIIWEFRNWEPTENS